MLLRWVKWKDEEAHESKDRRDGAQWISMVKVVS